MTITELRLVCDFYYALFGARKIPFHDSYRLLTLITRVIKCRINEIDRRRCLRIILFILLPCSVIGERCLIKESLFHRDLSSSWLPDNKMILSKDRYGYFFRKRRTKKTDVRDKNHKIVSLFRLNGEYLRGKASILEVTCKNMEEEGWQAGGKFRGTR